LDAALARTIESFTIKLNYSQSRLFGFRPLKELNYATHKLHTSYLRLSQSIQYRLHNSSTQLQLLSRALHSVSPLDTLSRGYAIVNKAGDTPASLVRSAVSSIRDISPGDKINTRFVDGTASSIVQSVEKNPEKD
jgi:exodeoxyribonuclease VII large subunit